MKKAFLFAGQGAQTVGMAADAYAAYPEVKALFGECEAIMPGITEAIFAGTAEQLAQTRYTQPAMFLADLGLAIAKEKETGRPDAVCGFSVGEIPALAYAGVFSYADGFRLICARANKMAELSEKHKGAMIAVLGLAPVQVDGLARSCPSAWAANFNCPSQTVAAVGEDSEAQFLQAVKDAGGKAIKLKVSGAFHCPYMAEAEGVLRALLQAMQLKAPQIPVYANLTARPYGGDIVSTLAKQVCSPVLFTDTVLNMRADGIEEFIEVGPGSVLTGLVKKI